MNKAMRNCKSASNIRKKLMIFGRNLRRKITKLVKRSNSKN